MLITIISWIIFGAIAGWITSLVVGMEESQGALGNIILGIIGALLGGFIVRLFGGEGVSGFNVSSLVVAIVGSILLLAVTRGYKRV